MKALPLLLRLFLFCLLFVPFCAFSQDPVFLWHTNRAGYCLKIHIPQKDQYYFVDDRTLCLPGSTGNGMEAYDEEGNRIKVYQFPDGGFQIDRVPRETDVYLYFGFQEKRPSNDGDRKITNDYLCFHDRGWEYWNHPNDWKNRIISDCRADIENTEVTDEVRVQRQDRIVEVEKWSDEATANYLASEMTNLSNRSTSVRMTRTYIDHRVNEDAFHRAYSFCGNLLIAKEGDYVFRLNSNANHALKIDDAVRFKRFGRRPSVTADEVSVHLTPGLHYMVATYHQPDGNIRFSVEWKKPGDSSFRELYEEDFAPASIPDFLELRDSSGKRYPLCSQIPSFHVFIAKNKTATLRRLVPLSHESEGAFLSCDREIVWDPGSNWAFKGHDVKVFDTPGYDLFAAEDDTTRKFTLNPPADSPLSPFEFDVRADPKRAFPIPPEISLSLQLPRFMYEDEEISLVREIRSRIPIPMQVSLLTEQRFSFLQFSRGWNLTTEDIISRAVMPVQLPAFDSSGMDQFRPDVVRKSVQTVKGSDISKHSEGFEFEYALQLPGFTFHRQRIAFVPANELHASLSVTPDGFLYCKSRDCRVIPVLKRFSQSELHRWELPHAIANKLFPTRHVLVIGEDEGSFPEDLRAELKLSPEAFHFIPWKHSGTGYDTLASLSKIIGELSNTDKKYDMLLVIPPNRTRRRSLSPAEEARVIALILETAKRLFFTPIHSIAVSVPIPPNPSEIISDDDQAYMEEIRLLKRMYGVNILEFSPQFEEIYLTPGAYRTPEDLSGNASESNFPVAASKKLAALFADAMRKMGNFFFAN